MGSARDNARDPRRAGSPVHPPLSANPHPQPLSVIAPLATSTLDRPPLEFHGTGPTRKYPNTAKEWRWQFLFPQEKRCVNLRTGAQRRHHAGPSILKRVVTVVARYADALPEIGRYREAI
jgi:hypothetical protein